MNQRWSVSYVSPVAGRIDTIWLTTTTDDQLSIEPSVQKPA
jgi:hypothetical protein